MASMTKSLMAYNLTHVNGRKNKDYVDAAENGANCAISADPNQRLAFSMLEYAVEDYQRLEKEGIIRRGKHVQAHRPHVKEYKRLNMREYEVPYLLAFFTDKGMTDWGFSLKMADDVRSRLRIA